MAVYMKIQQQSTDSRAPTIPGWTHRPLGAAWFHFQFSLWQANLACMLFKNIESLEFWKKIGQLSVAHDPFGPELHENHQEQGDDHPF